MREGVTYKPFDTCFDKFKVPKGIPAKEYKETGLFPIVSQEEEFISGYWDGEDKLVKIPRPVVIFGDHSRAVKYVDFDFVLGADGVKVLLPKTCFNAKYIYYFLKHYNVPSLGYSRHFKLLHEAEIPELSLSSQESIVKELDCIAAILDDKKRQLSELDSLAQAIFYDAFGDPISNTKHWCIKKIGDFSELVAGATPSTKVDEYWNDGTIAWLSSGEVGKRRIYKTESLITQKGYDSCSTRLVPAHTLLIALAGQGKTRGTVGVAEIPLCTNQSVCSFLTDETVDVDFLYYLLKLQYDKLRSISNSAGGRGGLNLTLLRNFSVIFPPLILQQEVSRKLKMVEEQKELIQQSIKEFENLLAQRMEFHFA